MFCISLVFYVAERSVQDAQLEALQTSVQLSKCSGTIRWTSFGSAESGGSHVQRLLRMKYVVDNMVLLTPWLVDWFVNGREAQGAIQSRDVPRTISPNVQSRAFPDTNGVRLRLNIGAVMGRRDPMCAVRWSCWVSS